MRKHWTLLIILTVLSTSTLIASNFQKGYVITSSMDTIWGAINNRSYSLNAVECCFIKAGNDSVIYFKPGEIYGYRFEGGKYYVSKYLKQENGTYFMEYIVKGKLDVFFKQSRDEENQFYVATDTLPLNQLIYEEKEVYENGLRYFRLKDTSTGILSFYTRDCPELSSKIDELKRLDQKKLTLLAVEYQKRVCPDGTCELFEKKTSKKIILSTAVGVGLFPLKTKCSMSDFFNREEKTQPYFSNSFGLLYQQPWISESSYFGIGYSDYYRIPFSLYYIPEGKGVLPISGYDLDLNDLMMSQNLSLGIQYPVKKFAFTLTGNLTTTFIIHPVAASLRFGLMYYIR